MDKTYPERFDTSNLDKGQKNILADFFDRRKLFDTYLAVNSINLFTCPGCGYPTLTQRGGYEICSVCNCEDDNQDNEQADEIWGGSNSNLSLTENRINIGEELKSLVEKTGGNLKDEPKAVLNVLSQRWPSLSDLVDEQPDNIL